MPQLTATTRRQLLMRGLQAGAAATVARYGWPPTAVPAGAATLANGVVDSASFMSLARLTEAHHALNDLGLRATGSPVVGRIGGQVKDRAREADLRRRQGRRAAVVQVA